jgi:CRP-like cAMP-binding protein
MIGRSRYAPVRVTATGPFAGCSPSELGRVDRLAHEVHLDAGTVLVQEGGLAQECFVILSGRAVVSRNGKVVATLGPNDFVGEMGFLDDCHRSATVEAATSIDALVFDRRSFAQLMEIPAISRVLLRELSERLRTSDEKS